MKTRCPCHLECVAGFLSAAGVAQGVLTRELIDARRRGNQSNRTKPILKPSHMGTVLA